MIEFLPIIEYTYFKTVEQTKNYELHSRLKMIPRKRQREYNYSDYAFRAGKNMSIKRASSSGHLIKR